GELAGKDVLLEHRLTLRADHSRRELRPAVDEDMARLVALEVRLLAGIAERRTDTRDEGRVAHARAELGLAGLVGGGLEGSVLGRLEAFRRDDQAGLIH